MHDLYTEAPLCTHPSCHWRVPESEGYSGIEARYKNTEGEPACWSHRDPSRDVLEGVE